MQQGSTESFELHPGQEIEKILPPRKESLVTLVVIEFIDAVGETDPPPG